jgi:ParB/RepB/Spo0J family partition protein
MAMKDTPSQTQDLDLSKLDFSPNAREHSPENLASLGENMRENGQLEEIIVSPKDGGRFEVISGTGRTLAARQLGWKTIRAHVMTGLSEFDKTHIAFSENDEVEGVSPIHQAELMARMMALDGMRQEELGKKIGKDQGYISKYLQVAALQPEVKANMNRFIFLGLAHLIQLCRLADPKQQIALGKQCNDAQWPVAKLKAEVDALLNPPKPPAPKIEDPLAPLWKKLQGEPLSDQGYWQPQFLPPYAWRVTYRPLGSDYRVAMAAFFTKLGAALAEEKDPIIDIKVEVAKHLPKIPEDQAAYIAAAKESVAAAYAWLYGADHPYVEGAKTLTWELMGFPSAEAGAQALLKSASTGTALVVPGNG